MEGGVRWGLAVLLLLAHAAEPGCRVACSSDAGPRAGPLSSADLHSSAPLHHSRSLLRSVFRSLRRQPAQAEEVGEGVEGSGRQKSSRSVRVKAMFHSRKRASADSEEAVLPAPEKGPLSAEAAASEGPAMQQSGKWRDLSPEERIAAALKEKALAAEAAPEQEEHDKPSQEQDAEQSSEVEGGGGEEPAQPDDGEDLQFSLDSILRKYNVKGTRHAPEQAPVMEAEEEAAEEGKAEQPAESSKAGDAADEDSSGGAEEGKEAEKEAEADEQELAGSEHGEQEPGFSWITTWLQAKSMDGAEDGARADYTLSSLLAVLAMGEVRSMVAAPCSNIDWLEPVLKTAAEHKEDFRFTCIDEDVKAVRATYSSELPVSFVEMDITEGGDLPQAQLLFSQDVLQDLPLKAVVRVLEAFARSGAELVLLGGTTQARTMRAGGSPIRLDLQQAPFLMDRPLLVFGGNAPDAPERQLLLFSGAYLRSLQWADMRARVKEFVAAQRRA